MFSAKKPMVALVATISLLTATTNSGARSSSLFKVREAINLAWCGKPRKRCQEGEEAWRVSWCESRHSIWARNGQYLGLFQMGSYAREKYGHAWNPWVQARAAHKYYLESGKDWSPWSCRYMA